MHFKYYVSICLFVALSCTQKAFLSLVGNWQESSEWMRTSPQFAANPIGMPVDPVRMVAASQTGASFTELHQRAYAGEFQPSNPLDLHVPL